MINPVIIYIFDTYAVSNKNITKYKRLKFYQYWKEVHNKTNGYKHSTNSFK